MEDVVLHFIVGSVVLLNDIPNKICLFKPFFNFWLLQEQIPLFHNILARGKYTLVTT